MANWYFRRDQMNWDNSNNVPSKLAIDTKGGEKPFLSGE